MRSIFDFYTMRFCGCIMAEVQDTSIREIFNDIDSTKIGYFTIYDRNGEPLYSTSPAQAEEAYDAAAVRREVETALTAFFGGKRLAKDLLRAELGQVVFAVPGVANYSLTSPAADVAVGADELPQAESIEVTAL